MIFLVVSLRRLAPNTSEQRSRSGLCKRVIRREAAETEGLVFNKFLQVSLVKSHHFNTLPAKSNDILRDEGKGCCLANKTVFENFEKVGI